jgi:hypothetical protein
VDGSLVRQGSKNEGGSVSKSISRMHDTMGFAVAQPILTAPDYVFCVIAYLSMTIDAVCRMERTLRLQDF